MTQGECDKELDKRLAVLDTRVSAWMESTDDYRKTLCNKIETLFVKVDSTNQAVTELNNSLLKLPCKERGIGSKLLWGAVGVVFTLLVTHMGWK